MPTYLNILWIPYLYLLLYFYLKPKKRIYAVSIIVITGILGYRLPLLCGYHAPLFYVGLAWVFTLLITSQCMIKHKRLQSDHVLYKAAWIYYIFSFMSVLFNFSASETVATYIVRLIGLPPLFFITVDALRSKKDIEKLINVFIVASLIMTAIGIGQFVTRDSLWGIQSTRKLDKGGVEYFTETIDIGYYGTQGLRVYSTGSNPNAFGAVMCMTIPFTMFYLLRRDKNARKKRLFYYTILGLQIFAIILSTSRTALFALFIQMIVLILLQAVQNKRWQSFFSIAISIVLIISIFGFLSRDPFYEQMVFSRFLRITEGGETGFFSGGYRMEHVWIPHLQQLSLRLLSVGYATPGIPGSSFAHNDFLAVLYYSGVWGFMAFSVIIGRFLSKVRVIPDKLFSQALLLSMIAYLVTGLAYENFIHKGQPYIFWPLLAIVARQSVLMAGHHRRLAITTSIPMKDE